MSAIAGILYFDGAPVAPGLIQKLTSTMAKRGPDEQTHWVDGSVALGHCMLRTTPESLEEHQPLMSHDESLVLVWDGRLDNRDELRRNLRSTGIVLRDNTDAELVLQSYVAWGQECPKHLLGDFTFAVWDARQKKLFCARDHMGARPFYYTQNDRFLAFASEEEALLELPGVSSEPNEEAIACLLVPSLQNFDNPLSFLRDVRGLLPGQFMMAYPDGSSKTEIYWRFEPGEDSYYASDRECESAFLNIFEEAVRCRMRTIGHPAAMMSGGIDSAGIAAMVHRLLPEVPGKEFHTYSAISDHPENCVESQRIQSLTRGLGDNAHFVAVPSFIGEFNAQDLVKVAWSKPHPVDNSIPLYAAMCQMAARQGDRVLLHGACGDITMDSPIYYVAHLLRSGQWREAWYECKAAGRNHVYLYGLSPISLLLRNAEIAYAPRMIEAFKRPIRRLLGRPPLAWSVISPGFVDKLRLVDRLREQEIDNRRLLAGTAQQAHAHLLNSLSRGLVSALAGSERVAGHYGVELRDPWADRRLVEFFLRLPLKYKVRDGWTKYLARCAFKPDLDEKVLWRPGKEHLGWLFVVRLVDETSEFVSRVLKQDINNMKQYVDISTVRKRYEKYQASRDDISRHFVYEMTSLLCWLRRLSSFK